jgi:hypothetical protein
MSVRHTVHCAVSFYHRETGLFNGNHLIASDDAAVKLNTPLDHIAIDGHYDHLSKKVDVESGQVVDYQPAPPSAEHEWNTSTRRWQLRAAVAECQQRHAAALARIAALEAAQHRPMRELAVNSQSVEARKRLEAIESEIASLRASAYS